jgi:5,10-methylenetetrahydromethanopterin reductase
MEAHRAHERVRRSLAYVLRGAHHARNLQLAGSQLDQTALSEAFAQENWKRIDELMTDDIVMRHCASGTPTETRTRLEAYRGAGLDEIVAYGMRERSQVQDVLAMMRLKPASIER